MEKNPEKKDPEKKDAETKEPERQRFVDQAAKSAHDVVTELHERAAKVEDELRSAAQTVTGGALDGTTVKLTDIEGRVRSAVSYFQENPFAAAALALGAGAMLTTMYWDKRPISPGKAIRSTKKPGAKAGTAKARRKKPTA